MHGSNHWYNVSFCDTPGTFLFGWEWFVSHLHSTKQEFSNGPLDNLNTHTPASFYETFVPEEARRLAERLEFHYTPKHGSWLNMADIELSVLARQYLDVRIPDSAALAAEVQAWQDKRNTQVVKVDWRFTTADARIKAKRTYPKIDD